MSSNDTHIIAAKPLNFSQIVPPEQLFKQFCQQEWAMWLDSSEGQHVDSRYDIIVWQPKVTLKTQNGLTAIFCSFNKDTVNSNEDPITLLKSYQQKVFANYKIEANQLPFMCGSVGYFSYDLARYFEKVPTLAKADIDIPEMAVGIYTNAIIYDRLNSSYQLLCIESERTSIENSLNNALTHSLSTEPFELSTTWQSNMSQVQYQEKFEKIQQYLQSGDCYQINLTQRFSALYKGCEYEAYLALREANRAPFSAFIRLNNCSILSISPERFVKVENNAIQSKPIKGTRPRGTTVELDQESALALKSSEKDQAENLMIVDLLRNDISKVAKKGSVTVPKIFDIESFPAVHHLVSTVEAELDPKYTSAELLRAAFPGGSITGAPKIRAMEIIDELEPHRRSVYCGSIGYLSACGNMDTSITIRTIIAENETLYCWAGGGIVADSKVNDEYQETYDKVNKILPILDKFYVNCSK